MLLTDFGISYKEVSDLGKLIRTFAQKEHKIVKTSTSKNIHANVLEFWLNETLSEAKLLNLPGSILKNGENSGSSGKRGACVEFGVDRLTLLNTGISNEGVDKLYRSLFATTVGFYQIIKEVIDMADSNKLRKGYLSSSGSSPNKESNHNPAPVDSNDDGG